MTFLLDTDVCVDLIRLRAPQLLAQIRSHAVGEIGISSISLAELAFGAAKSRKPEQNRAALEEFVEALEIAPFDATAANAYGACAPRWRNAARGSAPSTRSSPPMLSASAQPLSLSIPGSSRG